MEDFEFTKNNVTISGLTASGKTTHTILSQYIFG